MKKYICAFVILHYGEAKMTIDCVNNLLDKIKDEKSAIIVVDNNSPLQTGKQVDGEFESKNNVFFIYNKKNLGFANGNNVGYKFAKDVLNSEYICVMNNDVFILQENFWDLVKRIDENNLAVVGPHICLKNGEENAMYYKMNSVEELEKERNAYIKQLRRIKSSIWRFWTKWDKFKLVVRKLLGYIGVMDKLVLHEEMIEGSLDKHYNIILHGCCLIFMPSYIKKFDEGFDTETFMFREEELLYLRCRDKELNMLYYPEIEVKHLEDVSTNYIYNNDRKKLIFNYENQIVSLGILIKKCHKLNEER